MAIKSPAFSSEELKVFSLDTEIILSVLDKHATMLKVSDAWERKFHVLEENETKDSLFDFVHADDRQALEKAFGQALETGHLSQHISRFIDDSLTTYFVQFDLTVSADKVYLIGFDVTKSQEEHHTFVEMSRLSKSGAWYHDPVRGETYWSDEIYRIHDLEIGSEVNSEIVLNFFVEPFKAEIDTMIKELYEKGTAYDHTGEIVTAKGRRKWIHTIANPVVHQGKVIYVYGVTTDETRFRKYLSKVEQLAETQNLALKGVRSGLFDFNVAENDIFLSESFRQMVGLESERSHVPGDQWKELMYEEDRKDAMERFMKGISSQGNYHFNHFRIKNQRTGEVNFYEIHGWMKKNEEGNTIRMVGNLINVHDRVLLQQDAMRTMRSLEAMVNNGFIYNLLLDVNAEILLADETTKRIIREEYGVDPDAGKVKYVDAMPDAYKGAFTKSFREALGGKTLRREAERPLPDGAMQYLDVMYRPIFDDTGKVEFVLLNMMDVSEQKKAEIAMKAAGDKARYLNKLKSVILSNLSHEIRTPLSGIMGVTDILMDQIEDEEQRKLLEAQRESSVRILKHLTDLISLSDIETLSEGVKLESYDLNELTQLSYDIYNHQAKVKKLDFSIGHHQEPLPISADKEMFISALSAIINNALKYTEKGSVRVVVSKKSAIGQVEVIDTGKGIAPENTERIFEDFQQEELGLHLKYEGAGIGLSVAKKFFDLMDARISLSSKLGAGTTFTVSIPLTHESSNGRG